MVAPDRSPAPLMPPVHVVAIGLTPLTGHMGLRISVDDGQRWDDIEAAFAGIAYGGHEWDGDPAARVRRQRSDRRRVS